MDKTFWGNQFYLGQYMCHMNTIDIHKIIFSNQLKASLVIKKCSVILAGDLYHVYARCGELNDIYLGLKTIVLMTMIIVFLVSFTTTP